MWHICFACRRWPLRDGKEKLPAHRTAGALRRRATRSGPSSPSNPAEVPTVEARFLIKADGREGLDGGWVKTFPIQGGRYYRFSALRKVENVALPRRSAVVKITWLDAKGQRVTYDDAIVTGYMHGAVPRPRPSIRPTRPPTPAAGPRFPTPIGRLPRRRRRWSNCGCAGRPAARSAGAGVSLKETAPPPGRKVRLAAVHFQPQGGKTPADNCRMFAPLIAEAARQKADLVVLGECLTLAGNGLHAGGGRRADPRPVDRVLRPVGQEAQFVHRGRPDTSGPDT